MAKQSVTDEKFVKLKLTIVNIEADPIHKNRTIVSAKFDDGKGKPWIQAFSILPEESMQGREIEPDEFLDLIYREKIERPVDPYGKLKKAMQAKESFVINLPAKLADKR